MKIVAYILMVLAAVGAVVFACILRFVSNTALYDTNLHVFNKLSEHERSGIFQTTAQLMAFQIALLVVTNLLWATGVGIVLWRARKRHNHPATERDEATEGDAVLQAGEMGSVAEEVWGVKKGVKKGHY